MIQLANDTNLTEAANALRAKIHTQKELDKLESWRKKQHGAITTPFPSHLCPFTPHTEKATLGHIIRIITCKT